MGIGSLVHARVPFLRAIGRFKSRFCVATVGTGSVSYLSSGTDGTLRSVTGIGIEKEGLPQAFREPSPKALG